jgi:hypothetical protein
LGLSRRSPAIEGRRQVQRPVMEVAWKAWKVHQNAIVAFATRRGNTSNARVQQAAPREKIA